MKTLIKSIFFVLAVSTAASATSFSGTDPIDGKEIKDKSLFVFKTSKKFLGASVEVFHSNGEMLAAQTLAKRKMIIDFTDVKEGSYTIRVTKGNQTEEFEYSKR